MTKYLSCAETAKLMRQALKESFPDIKFGVKSKVYSGGASITVRWLDGPNDAQVDAVVDQFSGSYFDGMIDYKGSKYHKLDGEEISFGADFVFTVRDRSDAHIEKAIALVVAEYGAFNLPENPLVAFHNGDLIYVTPLGNADGEVHWSWQNLINKASAKHSDRLIVKESATLKRIQFSGDDGYGQGTVGRDGEGGNGAYKAMEQLREIQANQVQQ